jgi:hypothetical protein
LLLLRQLPWRHLPPLRLLLTLLRLLPKPLLLLQTPPRLLPMLLQLPQLAHRPLRSKAGTDFRACQPCWSL